MGVAESNTEQLLRETQEICSQYAGEVPSRRRAWPQSVRKRVFQLRQLEVPFEVIGQATGIPINTMYSWGLTRRQKKKTEPEPATFLPVSVPSAPSLLPAQPSRAPSRRGRKRFIPTVTVVVGSGIRLEGLTVEDAIRVARELGPGEDS